jgi:hypothetical protein
MMMLLSAIAGVTSVRSSIEFLPIASNSGPAAMTKRVTVLAADAATLGVESLEPY